MFGTFSKICVWSCLEIPHIYIYKLDMYRFASLPFPAAIVTASEETEKEYFELWLKNDRNWTMVFEEIKETREHQSSRYNSP